MSTARKTQTVAYVCTASLTVMLVAAGASIALTRGSDPAHPAASAAVTSTRTGAAPVTASTSGAGADVVINPPAPRAPSAVAPATLRVPPLRKLTPPDVVVTLPHAASTRAVRRLDEVAGVHRVVVADRGQVRLHGRRLRVLGVPLASIRGLTPSLTASSTPLWQSVARGELTVGYADSKRLRHHLGSTFTATGSGDTTRPVRIGAFATLGLPGAQALLSDQAAQALGVAPRREVFVVAPKLSLDVLKAAVSKTLGSTAHIDVTRPQPVDQSVSSSYAQTTIPAYYLDLYRRAAVTCPGLPWTVLAGIGTVETGNGRDVHRSSAGAEGPMQFEPSTWAVYGYDADGDGKADINDPVDAVFSAARYLCAAGASRGGQSLDDAIFAYNHAWWYVKEVITIANEYA